MKALFLTSEGSDLDTLVSAWGLSNEPAVHRTFNLQEDADDKSILRDVKAVKPDIIFYIAATHGKGLPSHDTLRALRKIALSIHLCWDATDWPWHEPLNGYKAGECFDLQVAIDGAKNAPTDMATLAPIDTSHYRGGSVRYSRCRFAGQNAARAQFASDQHPRFDILTPLIEAGWVEYRQRVDGPYNDYVEFIMGSEILLNVAHTGSGDAYHVKQRVLEAAFAGCALLEMRQAPTTDWIPEELLLLYSDAEEAEHQIHTATLMDKRTGLTAYVREHYSPEKIYGSILARL